MSVLHKVETSTNSPANIAPEEAYWLWVGSLFTSQTDYSKIYYHDKNTYGTLLNGEVIRSTSNYNRAPNDIGTYAKMRVVYVPTGEEAVIYASTLSCLNPAPAAC